MAKAKGDAAKATEARLAQANVAIDARVSAADQRIGTAREGALGEIETVATEAASDIVSRLAGVSVSSEAARGAVKEVLHA